MWNTIEKMWFTIKKIKKNYFEKFDIHFVTGHDETIHDFLELFKDCENVDPKLSIDKKHMERSNVYLNVGTLKTRLERKQASNWQTDGFVLCIRNGLLKTTNVLKLRKWKCFPQTWTRPII